MGASSRAALQLEDITKTFDGFRALDAAHVSVQPGEVHALLGENGAGKSTLMNVAAGLYAPDHGTVRIDGAPVDIKGPLDAQRLGIGMVHQHYKLVMPFNAIENVLLAHDGKPFRQAQADVEARVRDQADRLGFELDLARPVGDLSVAEQQRVEILKVLVAGARILILDEPTAVLTDAEADAFLGTVRSLAEAGDSVILVTHKLGEATGYCDRITVMRAGKTVDTVSADGVSASDLTTMIVGSNVHEEREPTAGIGAPALVASGLRAARPDGHVTLTDAGFTVHSGEIYGIAGVGGNGQTELADVLTGLTTCLGGKIVLAGGDDITDAAPETRREHGLAAIPADRQAKGLAGEISVADNYAVGGVLRGQYGGWAGVARRRAATDAARAVEAFDVQGVRSLHQRAALLSGGNAQKLLIAREFSGDPSIVLAHSPSRGLDIRAAAAVHDRLREARNRGAGVVLISEDLDEVLLLSDRIGVMNRGRIVAEFAAPADRHAVGAAMVSHG